MFSAYSCLRLRIRSAAQPWSSSPVSQSRDRQAPWPAIVDNVNTHWDLEVFDNLRCRDRLRRHRLGLHIIADVIGKVPHILNDQSVNPALYQCFCVTQGVVEDCSHAVPRIARGARQGPQMHHADDGFLHVEEVRQGFQLRTIHLQFPFWGCVHAHTPCTTCLDVLWAAVSSRRITSSLTSSHAEAKWVSDIRAIILLS